MRRTLVCLLLVVTTVTAAAQPGQTPPPQPYPYPQPQPYPQPYYPPQPYYQQPPQQPLTAAEHEILEDGPISDGAHFVGAAAALFIGFGSGQAIQGRWSERGWIFTVGEVASYVMILSGVDQGEQVCGAYECHRTNDDIVVLGVFALLGFRLWGTIDALSGPASHNRRYRQVRAKAGYPAYYYSAAPYITPASQGTGATAGVTVRF